MTEELGFSARQRYGQTGASAAAGRRYKDACTGDDWGFVASLKN